MVPFLLCFYPKMLLLPLILYFAIENVVVWICLQYDQKTTRIRSHDVERYQKRLNMYSYCLLAGSYIRDLLLAELVRGGKSDLIYSPGTQKILTYLSIATLLITVTCRFLSFKTIPLLEFFYPIYKKNQDPAWFRSFWSPIFLGSWTLYLTAFLWQPSLSALYPLIVYPLLLQGSFYFQEHCEEICAKFKTADLGRKDV
jgi:hypothetical protein